MAINKSAFIVFIFFLLSFGLHCSGASVYGRRTEQDPREQYEQCQRRCQREIRGEREQEQCEQRCEKQYKEQQEQQEERGRCNAEEPEKKYEECQQRCEQQEHRQRPQCQKSCERQLEEQQRQQQQEQYQQCQRRCQREIRGEREQEQCEQRCEKQYKEQQEQQEERGRCNAEEPQKKYEECQQRCEQQEHRQRPQCQKSCERQLEEQQRQQQQEQYQQCQRRCQREIRGEREKEQCEQRCEKQYKVQQEQQEERGRCNAEEPQKKYEECQQRCEQQEHRQRPQCQKSCERQLEEQQRQQQQEQYQQCQRRCQREIRGEREQEQCEQRCEKQYKEQQEQQEERGRCNAEEPQKKYEECQQRCEQQEHRQRPQCQKSCERQLEEQQRQQQQSQKQYQECQQRCQQHEQEQEQKQQCQSQCREQYQEEDEHNPRHKQSRREDEEEQDEEEQGQQRNNPYYFPHRRSFQTRFRNEEGKFEVLQRFTEKSPLLKGINNYRFAMFEANPNTFMLPHHCDAESIYFVTNGKGTITFVTHENKESYNVECGSVVRIPAGRTVYMVNQDNKEKLTIAVLALPVNNPGKSEEFFPVGNENPQSYYKIFSSEILETVLNTPREKLEKLFEGQRRQQRQQGVFRRAKPEQIRSMSQQATSPRQRGGERLAINLLSQSPVYSNQNGRFFEASPEEFKQLQNMDVAVAALKINQESIFVPHYNSKATFVVFVTEGKGYVEMACPHLSRQSQRSQNRREQEQEEEEEEQRTGESKKVKAQLSAGDLFVVPAGHPVTFFASKNQNLKTIGFGIYATNNQRIFLAGKKNLMRQMDREAKEISFGVPSKLVDEIFNNSEESYFMSFSQQRQHRGSEERRGNPLASFLDFARLF